MSNIIQIEARTHSILIVQKFILKSSFLIMIAFATLTSYSQIHVYAQNSESSLPEGYISFENQAGGYTMIHPSEVEIKEYPPFGILFLGESEPWTFGIIGPIDADGDSVEQLLTEDESSKDSTVELDSSNLEVDELPAQMRVSEDEFNRTWDIGVKNGDNFYQIKASAPKDGYSTYSDTLFTMLKSLQFTAR